jgi:hypothetical protein
MPKQRWRAHWMENGREHEFLFDSLSNRMIARIDFRLKYACAENKAGHVPDVFELEEVYEHESDDQWGNAAFPHIARGQF